MSTHFPARFEIAGRPVGPDCAPYIIAEAGSNHDRRLDRALALVDAAAEAGADAVKFQLFNADRIAARTRHPIARLDGDIRRYGEDLHSLYRGCELPEEFLRPLRDHAERRDMHLLLSTFDEQATQTLVELGVPALKVASFEMVHHPLLEHAAQTGLPIILSTGMADLDEVAAAVAAVRRGGDVPLCLLHCVSAYPAPPAQVNLSAMGQLEARFALPTGYSDHCEGVAPSIAAAALGACVIEKHFTLDRSSEGPDHAFAVEPEGLAALVRGAREAFEATRPARKAPMPSELENRARGRRSLFARADLPAGHSLGPGDIAVLRPGCGLAPDRLPEVLGCRLRRPLRSGDPLRWEDIEATAVAATQEMPHVR